MFIRLFNYSHPSATHDIMENFEGSRSEEGVLFAVFLSPFRESAGIHQSKNTNLNQRIPQILSPSAL